MEHFQMGGKYGIVQEIIRNSGIDQGIHGMWAKAWNGNRKDRGLRKQSAGG